METILVFVAFFIINVVLLKILQRIEYKNTKDTEANPIAVLFCFFAFIGTGMLILIILIESKIFDYKPKK